MNSAIYTCDSEYTKYEFAKNKTEFIIRLSYTKEEKKKISLFKKEMLKAAIGDKSLEEKALDAYKDKVITEATKFVAPKKEMAGMEIEAKKVETVPQTPPQGTVSGPVSGTPQQNYAVPVLYTTEKEGEKSEKEVENSGEGGKGVKRIQTYSGRGRKVNEKA